MFEDEEEIKEFLESMGFKFQRVSHIELIDELSCLQNSKLNLDKEKVRQYLSDKYTYVLSIKI